MIKCVDMFKCIDKLLKVGDWLERNLTSSPTMRNFRCQAEVRICHTSSSKLTKTSRLTAVNQPIVSSVLSSDSGLSSIRVESEPELRTDSEIAEIKAELIAEAETGNMPEGPPGTRVIYHYQREKFVVKISSQLPTFSDFLEKFHAPSCAPDLRFFFKAKNENWLELNDASTSPLPVENQLVEVRILEKLLS